MNKQISTRSAAIGAGLLLVVAVGGTVALNSSAASGATPKSVRPAAVRPAVVPAAGKVSIFMKASPLKGTSTVKGLEGWIPLTNISHSYVLPISNGQVTGRLEIGAFNVDKVVDITTPQLLTDLSINRLLVSVEIRVYQTNAAGVNKMITSYLFDNVRLTSDTFGQNPNAQVEHVGFVYDRVQMTQVSSTKGVPNQVFTYDTRPL